MDMPIFSALLAHAARAHAHRDAVVAGGRSITYAAFNARVNRLANGLLASGLRPGDAVAAYMPSRVEMLEAYWATAKAGLTFVPVNAMLQVQEIAGIFALAQVRCVLVDASMEDRLPPKEGRFDIVVAGAGDGSPYEDFLGRADDVEPDVVVDPDATCTVMFSSGTTSRPKGIVNSQQARAIACHIYAAEFGLTFESRTLLATPLYHNSLLILALPTMAVGGCVVLEERFEPDSSAAVWRAQSISHALLVPTQLRRMLASERMVCPLPDSLRCLVSVGESLPIDVCEQVLQRLTPWLYTMYGISEGLATVLRPEMQRARSGSVGTPVLYTEIRIVDDEGRPVPPGSVGEVIGRSARMMTGYLQDPSATAQALRDGWLFTGDLGELGADGFLRIVGRKKDMILSGGVNIYPQDIERVVANHPDVQDAVALGMPDSHWGEVVKLVVVPRAGTSLTPASLTQWFRTQLPGYQRPKVIEFRASLPRNETGKVVKRLLTTPDLPSSNQTTEEPAP